VTPAAAVPARRPVPGHGWRLVLYRVCWEIAVGLSRLYFPGGVDGRENLPAEGPYVLAPVHRSYVDWLVVARVTRRRLRYIAKDSLWKSKQLGWFIELLGAFPVHRGTADREAFHKCLEVLEAGEPLVLFPEGTRRSGPVVEHVLDGAAYLALRAEAPIVPVGIGGSERRMPKGSALPRPGRIHIVVGEPIHPREWASAKSAKSTSQPGGRVSRSATRALSGAVRWHMQACFDQAQSRLGIEVASTAQLTAAGVLPPERPARRADAYPNADPADAATVDGRGTGTSRAGGDPGDADSGSGTASAALEEGT
jgi:1-acyl-sn-glycerol-3-phosphate acyltransferase